MDEESTSLITETPPIEAWHSEEYNEIVERKGWKSPDDAVKSYREAEVLASSQIKLPTDESSPEEKSAFYTKIGRPDTPEGYEITDIPENVGMDDETLNQLRHDAFEAGVPKVAFETVLKNYLNRLSEQVVQSRVDGEKVLKEEVWKGDYDKNLEIAKRYVSEHCSDEFKQYLEDTGQGNNPIFAKHFYEQGKKTLRDTLIKGSQKDGSENEPEWKPAYPNSPDMYKNGDDEESKKARAYFTAKGHVY
jgi:hypothetical protein